KRGGDGSPLKQASAKFAPCRRFIRPSCSVVLCKNGLRGAIFWRSRRRSITDKRPELRRQRLAPRRDNSARSSAPRETQLRKAPPTLQRAYRWERPWRLRRSLERGNNRSRCAGGQSRQQQKQITA